MMHKDFDPRKLRIAIAQINTTVGDLRGNVEKIIHNINEAKKNSIDLIAFPELTITGYPPEDLLLQSEFIEENLRSLKQIVKTTENITSIIGFVDTHNQKLFNSAAVICNGKICGTYHKMHLPNYGVFDEKRYFKEGIHPVIFELNGIKIGVSICEDLWIPDSVIDAQALNGGIEIGINISASPYCSGKIEEREKLVIDKAVKNRIIMSYVNLVGGQDELVFDGSSLIVDENGETLCRCKEFEEDLLIFDLDVSSIKNIRNDDIFFQNRKQLFTGKFDFKSVKLPTTSVQTSNSSSVPIQTFRKLDYLSEVYQALVLGTRDYVFKNGFTKVVLGLSGGIDSALTAAIAVDALGEESIVGVAMPSEFSSQSSLEDARQLATNLDIEYIVIPIQRTFEQYKEMLKPVFSDLPFDTAEENIQARIRGNIIMGLSNKFGWVALTTGNKSEWSVGYCTLYGDMAGGFAVIKDVPKTLVFQLAKNLNEKRGKVIIPLNTLNKAPSAELRHNQKDEDSLPPYRVLDPILSLYIEKNATIKEIVNQGFDEETVRHVIRLVDINEYKRRQGPPGIKITPRAFGKDRRMPVTNKYRI